MQLKGHRFEAERQPTTATPSLADTGWLINTRSPHVTLPEFPRTLM